MYQLSNDLDAIQMIYKYYYACVFIQFIIRRWDWNDYSKRFRNVLRETIVSAHNKSVHQQYITPF